ncbi:MAG: serine/threonine-protein kinase [Balneolaceae bacterium]|nr:serine/threonine-protein kinase [Balneolaceae bacterium]MDR9407502.1 serine/threonine-protein kinase [Balneolaceae bacterium]
MNSQQWDDIQDLFHQCIELSLDEQKIFLDNLKEKKPQISAELKKLLDAHHMSGTFLEDEILEEEFISEGDRVGPWRIIREIGRGGMSSVFLATRADGQFEREVAIKFLHGLIPGQSMHKRLQQEQKILARLQHKNIAQLIDAGLTDEGRPYFILEYIQGKPITEWCNEQHLSFEERLQLFVQVCEAVQFAHQRLIVHRDLKPNNILVDNHGNVKLLDFGIAKILENEPQESTPITKTGLFLMTPEYASPEQVHGDAITTATDVHALGLILYELLTGKLPYDFSNKTPIEIGSIISETTPAKPSSVVIKISSETIQLGSINKAQHKRQLRGDLDTIVLKSIRKEPERRYGSADQLLQDIRRYQKNEPISARPESAGYLTKKFIQRNRTVVFALSVIGIILVGTAIFSLNQARITEIERQKTEQVNAFLQEMLASPNPYQDGLEVKVIDILDRTADRIDIELSNQPAVEASVRHTLGVTYRELGDIDKADFQLSQSLALMNTLFSPPNAEMSEVQVEMAKTEQMQGNYQTADSLLNLALTADLELFGRESTTIAARLGELGSLQWEMGNFDEAEALLRESLELEQKLRSPDHEQIASSMGNLATLLSDQGYDEEALELYREELKIYRANYEDDRHPAIPQVISHIGIILDDQEKYEEALADHQKALELFRELKGEDHPDVVYAMNNLASVMTKMGNVEEALAMQVDAAALYRDIFGPDHPSLGIQYNNIAFTKRNMGDLEGAKESYSQAIETWQAGLPPGHPFLAYGYHNLASVLQSQNRPGEALPYFQDAYEIRTEHLSPENPERAMTTSMLGECLASLGKIAEAEPLLIEGYQSLLVSRGEDHSTTMEAANRLKDFLQNQDRVEEFAQIKQETE